ncbi:HEXXH motif domain-containing protein [Amycolatopsis sp. OK19-0408]|uniref:HEXXH motif domain-containing protein n=1 Tax=Amycolatopsis iheyensis TaxID=2945988 RepID=A0A9X2N3T3_9PSEU|nr:HEXXH motif domain-containing protein [Amycolatopsis iheyensis]MCR6481756.1 HEXXH motif domain-containing protein [Amycolatopsis iheyensis]
MQAELLRHQLPLPFFAQLSAGPASPAVLGRLRAGQLSRRKLQLRALTELLDLEPDAGEGPETPAHAWSVLVTAERRHPEIVEELLLHPSAGVWLTRTLRTLSGAAVDSTPLRTDLGYLSSIAAAAALRCGVACTISVPVVHGVATFPTVGQAKPPSSLPVGSANLEVTPGGTGTLRARSAITFSPAEASPGFVPVNRHTVESGGLRLSVEIDDRGPYRTFSTPIAPRPLDPLEYAEWTKLLDEAWQILTSDHRGFARELSSGMTTLVPLENDASFAGASSSVAFGAIAMTAKFSAVDLAEALVHELQHSKLNALFDLVELLDPDFGELLHAPWREDPRPASGLLHGIFAFVTAVEFWRVRLAKDEDDSRYAQFHYAQRRRQVRHTATVLLGSRALTGLGRSFVESLSDRLAAAEGAPVAAEIQDAVTMVADEQLATWRLRHLRPDDDWVSAAAEAWLAGEEPPRAGPASVTPWRRSLTGSARVDLVKLRHLGYPVRPARRRELSAADLAYVHGEWHEAQTAYVTTIRATPQDDQAWLGLGLAAAIGPGGHRNAMLTAPHLVLAVRDRLLSRNHPCDRPVELVAWLGRA